MNACPAEAAEDGPVGGNATLLKPALCDLSPAVMLEDPEMTWGNTAKVNTAGCSAVKDPLGVTARVESAFEDVGCKTDH